MNQVIETILTRRAVRKYEKTPVPRELLEQIVDCGRYAPSALGLQTWHFTVVTDRKMLDRISAANAKLALAAESLGLNTCYLASFVFCLLGEQGAQLRKDLGIPEGYTPNLALAIGYGADAPTPAPRREGCVNWVE